MFNETSPRTLKTNHEWFHLFTNYSICSQITGAAWCSRLGQEQKFADSKLAK